MKEKHNLQIDCNTQSVVFVHVKFNLVDQEQLLIEIENAMVTVANAIKQT